MRKNLREKLWVKQLLCLHLLVLVLISSSPIELIEELKAKVASLEREKEEVYKKGQTEQAAKNSREIISSIIICSKQKIALHHSWIES